MSDLVTVRMLHKLSGMPSSSHTTLCQQVQIMDLKGQRVSVRLAYDEGSKMILISETLCHKCRVILMERKSSVLMSDGRERDYCTAKVTLVDRDVIEAVVVPRITC